MSAIARPKVITTNVVEKAIALSLPVPMYLGNISLTCSLESHPSGSLEYTVVSEADLNQLERAYRIGARFSIDGVSVAVNSYGYSRERAYLKNLAIDTYKVSIGLGGIHERKLKGTVNIAGSTDRKTGKISVSKVASKAGVPYSGPSLKFIPSSTDVGVEEAITGNARRAGCFVDYNGASVRLKTLGSGGGRHFGVDEILNDGENTRSELPYHKNAVLNDSWSKLPQDKGAGDEPPDFDREEPQRDVLVEVDREDYYLPPPGTRVLRTLDSNADKGGPKAVKKEVYSIDGQRVLEKVWVYGFLYTAEDIHVGNGVLFSDSPADFWTVVEYTETTVVFETINPAQISLRVFDDEGNQCKVIVHPDYRRFVSGSGTSFRVSGTAEYMLKENTTGFRWARLKEEGEAETLFPDDPFYSTYQFRKLPKVGKRTWLLKSTRDAFGSEGGDDQFGHPFRVEWVALKDLPPSLMQDAGYSLEFVQRYPDRLVAILYPEINFIEPFYVDTEVEYASTFYSEPNPESTEDSPLPPLITGSETYNWGKHVLYSNREKRSGSFEVTTRKDNAPDHHRKLTSAYSSQDAGFSRSALAVKSQEFAGQPAAATTRNRAWQEKEAQANEAAAEQGKSEIFYRVTSSEARGSDLDTGSVSVQNAESLQEAIRAIKTQLRIDACSAVQSSRTVAWWVSGMRPGSRVSVDKERFFGGSWMVMSVALNMEVIGLTPYGDGPMQLTSGTSLTLGQDRGQSLNVSKEGEDSPAGDAGGGEQKRRFAARYSFSTPEIGEVVPQDVIGRRSFSEPN